MTCYCPAPGVIAWCRRRPKLAARGAQVGPPALLPGGESGEEARARLRAAVEAFGDEAPFTLQRLAEVLLEPRKQYARLDKLVRARAGCTAPRLCGVQGRERAGRLSRRNAGVHKLLALRQCCARSWLLRARRGQAGGSRHGSAAAGAGQGLTGEPRTCCPACGLHDVAE